MTEENQLKYKSDDNPKVVLRILKDCNADIWVSITDPEKGYMSFRACTHQGGGKNLTLRQHLADLIEIEKTQLCLGEINDRQT